jgi:hypothetical protein
MSDRRRAPRYVLETPLRGQAMPMQDALVEDISDDRLVVVAASARLPYEELIVHLPGDGETATRSAQVLSSTPFAVGGAVSFRLELKLR